MAYSHEAEGTKEKLLINKRKRERQINREKKEEKERENVKEWKGGREWGGRESEREREREVCSCMRQLHASQYYSPNSVPSYPSSAYAQSLPSCCQVFLISPARFEKSSFVPSTVLIWNIEHARTRRNLYFFRKENLSLLF